MARLALNPKSIKSLLNAELKGYVALRKASDAAAEDVNACDFWEPKLRAEIAEMDRRIARMKAEKAAGFWGGTVKCAKLIWPSARSVVRNTPRPEDY